MNIWDVNPDVNNYMWIMVTETDNMNCVQFSHLMDSNGKHLTFKEDVSFHYQDDNNNKIGDIMYAATNCWLANEKAKSLISEKYCELFQFIPTLLENEPDTKYYIMLSLAFSYALDMDKSVYEFYKYSDNVISSISSYYFNDEARKYPFFRLKQRLKQRDYFHECRFYSNDEFKNFIEKNNITGLKFTKIFAFED